MTNTASLAAAPASDDDDDANSARWRQHLDWSAKQGRILTDDGAALRHYSARNGFPFSPRELPHHYLERGRTRAAFRTWAAAPVRRSPIVGAWGRPLFAGRRERSTDRDEAVYNVQTGGLFVDLRIPRGRPAARGEATGRTPPNPRRVLESLSNLDLRLQARQHAFGGWSVLTTEAPRDARAICTRHHCLDWNYVDGKPRPRPNKWYVERENDRRWKERSYATDGRGQSYYFELWQRLTGDDGGAGARLAMRTQRGGRDGLLVVVGDHFNYLLGRQWTGRERAYPQAENLVELVDAALAAGDRATAASHLTLQGGHGTLSSGWRVDASLQPWDEGRSLFDLLGRGAVRVGGEASDVLSWEVSIGATRWCVYESSCRSTTELEQLLTSTSCISRL